jgi:hypothetical protein
VSQERHTVIIVYSTSHAMRIEKLIQEMGISCKMIPVPRQINSNCGLCVRIQRTDIDAALSIIADAQIQIEGIHEV